MVKRKLYITAGIGARHAGEAFGEAYELPNDSAYCETCAAIGLALWAHRLNLMHGDAWKPVAGASACGVALNKFNRTACTPVETTALRLEVQLKPEFHGGILEWKVE